MKEKEQKKGMMRKEEWKKKTQVRVVKRIQLCVFFCHERKSVVLTAKRRRRKEKARNE